MTRARFTHACNLVAMACFQRKRLSLGCSICPHSNIMLAKKNADHLSPIIRPLLTEVVRDVMLARRGVWQHVLFSHAILSFKRRCRLGLRHRRKRRVTTCTAHPVKSWRIQGAKMPTLQADQTWFVGFVQPTRFGAALLSHGIRVLQGHIVRPGCQVMTPHIHAHAHTLPTPQPARSPPCQHAHQCLASSCSVLHWRIVCVWWWGGREKCHKLDSAAHSPPLDTTVRP
jgi:hypothetical protein